MFVYILTHFLKSFYKLLASIPQDIKAGVHYGDMIGQLSFIISRPD
jgi:hypothetical protein